MASSARFDELKKKFDENPRRYFAPLANEFRKSGDAAQAVMICEEFLPQQPGHMSGHIVYGQALFDLGRLDDARTVFETALTLDPENLIALRHLGDIARSHGDLETARHWYQRVLDADPRNEEVQALIAEVDGGASPPPMHAEPASSEPVTTLDLAPAFEAPTSAPSDATAFAPPPLPTQPRPVTESLLELDVVEEQVISAPLPSRSASDDAPFESISLEGLEPTSASTPPAERSGHAEGFEPMEFTPLATTGATPGGLADGVESGEFTAPSARVEPLAGLEESAVGAFEARPDAAPAPAQALPDLEPLPGTDDRAADQPPVDIPPEVIAAEAELMDARERSAQPEPEPTTSSAGASIPEFEAPAPAASSESVAPAESAPRATPSQPFVTETMAELYVKQGFREQALDVYRLLLAASPDSQRLRDRVAELQAPAEPDSGPNVREFFARFAARRPDERSAAAVPPASDDFASLESFEAFETVAVEEPPPATGAPPAAAAEEPASGSTSETGGGSIDALFGQRPVGPADASAASALAQAFGGGEPEPPPITGRPARAAAGELSLDSVFRDGGARPPRGAQSFSFDQFFSESATAEGPPEPGPTQTPSQGTGAQSEAPERSADDIEQFNSWLQGLKQR